MSKIGKNIRKIRTVKKLSQAAFAQIFNLARPSVGAYEEGRAEPRIDTILQIANYFGLSIDALLKKDLTINELVRFDSLKNKKQDLKTIESHQRQGNARNLNTKYIPSGKMLDYISNYRNLDYIDGLMAFHLPNISSTPARAFDVTDNAMSFDHAGIVPGDIVISDKKISVPDELHLDQVYVAILDDRMIIRRLQEKQVKLKLSADHPDWQNQFIPFETILELWEVNSILTRNILPPIQYNKRLSLLEDQVLKLTADINSLRRKISKR